MVDLCLSRVDVVVKVAFKKCGATRNGMDWGDELLLDEFVNACPSDFEVGACFVDVKKWAFCWLFWLVFLHLVLLKVCEVSMLQLTISPSMLQRND
jgi:hypothetical protein